MIKVLKLAIKLAVNFSLLLYILLRSGTLANSVTNIVEVSCNESDGCFRLLESTVQSTPEGTIVRIHKGIYYEKSLTVSRSLSIEAVEPEVVVHFIDPYDGLRVNNLMSSDQIIDIIIKGITLLMPVPTQLSILQGRYDNSLPAAVVITNDTESVDQLKVTLENVSIEGYIGIIADSAHLIVNDSKIIADGVTIATGSSKVELRRNSLIGGTGNSNTTRINVALINNQETSLIQNRVFNPTTFGTRSDLEQWGVLLEPQRGSSDSEYRVVLAENSFDADVGVVLAGLVNAELNSNRFTNNQKYGLLIFDPSCTTVDNRAFVGTLTGKDNEFQGNGQDVCPADFPLPEGFLK